MAEAAIPGSDDELLTTGEAARAYGRSRTYVYWLVRAGEIPSRKAGRHRLIARRDLESFMRTHATAA